MAADALCCEPIFWVAGWVELNGKGQDLSVPAKGRGGRAEVVTKTADTEARHL